MCWKGFRGDVGVLVGVWVSFQGAIKRALQRQSHFPWRGIPGGPPTRGRRRPTRIDRHRMNETGDEYRPLGGRATTRTEPTPLAPPQAATPAASNKQPVQKASASSHRHRKPNHGETSNNKYANRQIGCGSMAGRKRDAIAADLAGMFWFLRQSKLARKFNN